MSGAGLPRIFGTVAIVEASAMALGGEALGAGALSSRSSIGGMKMHCMV